MNSFIDETLTELKQMLDDPRCGLKESSNTNKNRSGILALFQQSLEKMVDKCISVLPEELAINTDRAKSFNFAIQQAKSNLSKLKEG